MEQPAPGQSFAGFTIERVLGAGGMGVVYLARHPRLPRRIALKLLNRDRTDDEEIRTRFLREAENVSRLEHPNIVGVYDRGQEAGQLWISMQYVAGGDAGAAVRAGGPLPPARAVRIVTEAAKGLDFAHSQGVLHRDVKPANILLADAIPGWDERILLADFGIAKSLTDTRSLTETGTLLASLHYAAPEVFDFEVETDSRADVYSLGCTLYQLLTGELPYRGTTPMQLLHGHISAPVPKPSQRHALPPGLDTVIARALAKNRDDRYRTCGELAYAAQSVFADPARRLSATTHRPSPSVADDIPTRTATDLPSHPTDPADTSDPSSVLGFPAVRPPDPRRRAADTHPGPTAPGQDPADHRSGTPTGATAPGPGRAGSRSGPPPGATAPQQDPNTTRPGPAASRQDPNTRRTGSTAPEQNPAAYRSGPATPGQDPATHRAGPTPGPTAPQQGTYRSGPADSRAPGPAPRTGQAAGSEPLRAPSDADAAHAQPTTKSRNRVVLVGVSVAGVLALVAAVLYALHGRGAANDHSASSGSAGAATNVMPVARATGSVPVAPSPTAAAFDVERRTLYVTDSRRNSVSLVDVTRDQVVGTVAVGANPCGLALDAAAHTLYTANVDDQTVSAIDTGTRAVTSIQVGKVTARVAVDESTHTVFASNPNDNTVTVIDGTTAKVVDTVAVPAFPWSLAVDSSSHRLYVAAAQANQVAVVDTATHSVVAKIRTTPNPGRFAIDAAMHTAYLTHEDANLVSVIDLATQQVTDTIPVGAKPIGIALDAAAHSVYVSNLNGGTISVIDTRSPATPTTLPAKPGVSALAVDPATHILYATNEPESTVTIYRS
ncbi:serine/threonine-protein kinase [Nocardia stercoris]|uniref:Protein kinase domain-containing protein n=1 Tax=Nocardia stercoris TaxID=2483361 RepID=A0A3M2LFA2_9NOCA|nr:serine/threonine-protein kinase [Nocardia stercoris]RMI35500.1 hypothetical protein EBN03_04410 [Nocardia stercoris]